MGPGRHMRHIAFILGGFLAPAIIYGWSQFYTGSCLALLLPALGAVFLFDYARADQQAHRDVIADGYFHPGGILHAFARASVRIAILSLFSAVLFTLALFTTVANWNPLRVHLLLGNAVLIVLLYALFLRFSRSWRVKERFAAILARHWTVGLNTLVGLGALGYLAWISPPPEAVTATSLQDALQTARPDVVCLCPDIGAAVRLQAEAEAIGLWTLKSLSPFVPAGLLNTALWLPYLLSGGLAVAGYTRMALRLIDLFRLGGQSR